MQENRKNKRVLFPPEDDTLVHFYAFNTGEIVAAKVVNLSEGGICIAPVKEELKSIPKIGDKLVLLKIESPKKLNFLLNADLEITWALTHETLEQFGLGCKFESLSDTSKKQIEKFLLH